MRRRQTCGKSWNLATVALDEENQVFIFDWLTRMIDVYCRGRRGIGEGEKVFRVQAGHVCFRASGGKQQYNDSEQSASHLLDPSRGSGGIVPDRALQSGN